MSDHSKQLLLCSETVYTVPMGSDEYERRIPEKAHIVKRGSKSAGESKSIKYNYHEADVTVLEGILARGDRRLAPAIQKAYEAGAIFDA